jgi:hypothetical protein
MTAINGNQRLKPSDERDALMGAMLPAFALTSH